MFWVCHTSYRILAGLLDETSPYFKKISLLVEAVSSAGPSKVANSIPEQRASPTQSKGTHIKLTGIFQLCIGVSADGG